MATLGRACLILALAVAVYGVGAVALRRAHAAGREWVDSGRRAVYALAALTTVAFVVLEIAFLRSDFSFADGRDALLDDDADLLPGGRGVVLAGGLAAAVGVAAVAVVEPRAVPDARAACATSRPTRRRSCSASAAFFSGLLVFVASPFATRRRRADGGRRACHPLLRHPTMMIHPPMLYSGYTLFTVPVRVRGRGARRPARRRRVDHGDAALRARPPGSSSASGSCSAPAGPTPSWAGAATGPGTRSRTPR